MDCHLEAMSGWLGSMTICCTPMVRFGKWQIDFHRPGAGDPEINIDQSKNLLEVERGNDLLAALCIAYAFDKALCQPLVTIIGYQEKEHMDDDDSEDEDYYDEEYPALPAPEQDQEKYPALPYEGENFEPAGYIGYNEEDQQPYGYIEDEERGFQPDGYLEGESQEEGFEPDGYLEGESQEEDYEPDGYLEGDGGYYDDYDDNAGYIEDDKSKEII